MNAKLSGLLPLAFLALATSTAAAQNFSGKTITMIINYGAGGNVDSEGRIFERHLPKHVAGKPNIIVQNVPGAGGLTAVNQMGAGVGVKDPSTTMGFVTFNPMAILTDDPALRVRMDNFAMIASVGGYYVVYGRKELVAPSGRPQDILKGGKIHAAGFARSTVHDVRLRLMLDLLGADYQIVTGFQSSGAVNLAMAQNEINFMLSSLPAYENQVVPNLINKDVAVPLWQIATRGDDGSLTGSDKLRNAGVAFFEDVYTAARGKAPEGVTYNALQIVNDLRAKLARAILMPPGARPEAVEEMRRAIASLATDKEFIADYLRITKEEPILIDGATAQKLVKDAVTGLPPDVKAVLRDAAGVK
jgi:tripartite-type tricarboxylate transporter receptor subunit TctC